MGVNDRSYSLQLISRIDSLSIAYDIVVIDTLIG